MLNFVVSLKRRNDEEVVHMYQSYDAYSEKQEQTYLCWYGNYEDHAWRYIGNDSIRCQNCGEEDTRI